MRCVCFGVLHALCCCAGLLCSFTCAGEGNARSDPCPPSTAVLPHPPPHHRMQTFIALGVPPNPDLAALVANPSPGNSLLYPTRAWVVLIFVRGWMHLGPPEQQQHGSPLLQAWSASSLLQAAPCLLQEKWSASQCHQTRCGYPQTPTSPSTLGRVSAACSVVIAPCASAHQACLLPT